MGQAEIALILSTFERPAHLRRSLLSIALQQNVAGKMELIVTDDGSRDETPQLVEEFARQADFPVRFTTHPHGGFHLARCRNEGVAASTAAYLLFLDGDCVLPPDHIAQHLQRRRPGVVMAGDCCRLDRDTSQRIDEAVIRCSAFLNWMPAAELRRLAKEHRKAQFYNLIGHPTKPKLVGNNIGVWREDFERVNGYDENFRDWGCEDDDLGYRLRRAGVRIESILRWTFTCHLWHPPHVSQPQVWKEGRNADYLLRKCRLTCCRNGLRKRAAESLAVRVLGSAMRADVRAALSLWKEPQPESAPEIEIVLLPGEGRFSGEADYNILIVQKPTRRAAHLARRADVVVSEDARPDVAPARHVALEQVADALRALS